MKFTRREILGAAAASAFPLLGRAAEPDTIRIVVPLTAGSGSDLTARALAQAITVTSGKTVVVDNKPGAGASIGSLFVAKSKPDGLTLLLNTGAHTTNSVLIKNLPFDPIADFTPITRITSAPGFALFVSSRSPYKTLKQFIEAAKNGKLTYGSSGIGNTTHVIAELFCRAAGVDMLHVPYKGSAINELLGGQVDCAFIAPSLAASWIRSGQFHGLGISGSVRSALLPDTPTFNEAGLNVPDIPAWSGLWGPRGMSDATVGSLYTMLVRAGQETRFSQLVKDGGGTVEMMPPQDFRRYVESEVNRYKKVLPPLGIQVT
ncbi:tripartite tricarboxylate transporter substrate binding protein [Variovorax rhizosphaerae]|uniref:Tripartite tricarboxylate transporter substrate binding protein n=1 Tax=Variovorax rhizosphaerae TaxID=1836200 RepID=A0ABU8WFJ3_9BURK